MLSEKKRLKRGRTKRVEKPANVVADEQFGVLTIRCKPRRTVATIIPLLFLVPFIVVPIYQLGQSIDFQNPNFEWLGVTGLFLLVWYGMLMFHLHSALVKFMNTGTYTLEGRTIRVERGPIPQRGDGEYDVSSLIQLFCVRHKHKGKRGHSYSYSLNAEGDALECLASGLYEDEALYLEMRLEDALGIVDEKVEGEHRGK